jgi:hypothetical protein
MYEIVSSLRSSLSFSYFYRRERDRIIGEFTPTFLLPPQGGGNEKI